LGRKREGERNRQPENPGNARITFLGYVRKGEGTWGKKRKGGGKT